MEALHDAGHRILAAVCQPDRPSGRGRKLSAPPVKEAALRLGIPVLQPERPRGPEFISSLQSLSPEISVVVAYGHILRPEILTTPRLGSINLHASLLPAWRGAAPIQRAIAAGDTTGGLSVIQMDEGMDSGDILATHVMEIGEQETAGELAERMSAAGGPLLVEVLSQFERGEVTRVAQYHGKATFAPKIDRDEARIGWTRPAPEVANGVRAFDPVPGAWTRRGAEPLKLFRPSVLEGSGQPGEAGRATDGGLVVACGSGAVAFAEVQAQGKRRMAAQEYFRGHPLAEGEKFE
jgi:methionyl-tRNA formyltransferase